MRAVFERPLHLFRHDRLFETYNSCRGLREGASEDKLREIAAFATSPHYSAAERAALGYAEAMTITGQKVSDELFAEVRRHFS